MIILGKWHWKHSLSSTIAITPSTYFRTPSNLMSDYYWQWGAVIELQKEYITQVKYTIHNVQCR